MRPVGTSGPAAAKRESGPSWVLVGAVVAGLLGPMAWAGATEPTTARAGVPPLLSPAEQPPGIAFRPNRALARSCWEEVVTVVSGGARKAEVGQRIAARLLATAHGVWLTTELCRVLSGGADVARPSRIEVRLQDTVPPCTEEGFGCFEPVRPHAERYRIFVRVQDSGVDPEALAYGEYPGNPDCTIVYLYRQPESWMAETLFHELLHVWYLNAAADRPRRYPTGHGDVSRCEFEDDFMVLLDAFSRELAALEGRAPERLIPLWRTEGARRR